MDRVRQLSIRMIVAFFVLGCTTATAQRFSVQSTVTADGQQTAAAEALTIFDGDQVYDFMLTPHQEVAVMDWKREVVELFDPVRQRRCEVSWEFLLRFVDEVEKSAIDRPAASTSQDGLIAFSANPMFSEEFDEKNSVLRLHSDLLTYEVQLFVPEIPQAADLYCRFADWSARLATTQKGALPPTARLRLNYSLVRLHSLPKQVRRSVTQKGVTQAMISNHVWRYVPSESDLLRIQQLDEYRRDYPQISFLEYRGLYTTQIAIRDRDDSTH